MDIPPEVMILIALFCGAIAHWFLEAWRDQKITEPELKSLPTILVMVICVAFVALATFTDEVTAFFAGFAIDSVFKNLFRIVQNGS